MGLCVTSQPVMGIRCRSRLAPDAAENERMTRSCIIQQNKVWVQNHLYHDSGDGITQNVVEVAVATELVLVEQIAKRPLIQQILGELLESGLDVNVLTTARFIIRNS